MAQESAQVLALRELINSHIKKDIAFDVMFQEFMRNYGDKLPAYPAEALKSLEKEIAVSPELKAYFCLRVYLHRAVKARESENIDAEKTNLSECIKHGCIGITNGVYNFLKSVSPPLTEETKKLFFEEYLKQRTRVCSDAKQNIIRNGYLIGVEDSIQTCESLLTLTIDQLKIKSPQQINAHLVRLARSKQMIDRMMIRYNNSITDIENELNRLRHDRQNPRVEALFAEYSHLIEKKNELNSRYDRLRDQLNERLGTNGILYKHIKEDIIVDPVKLSQWLKHGDIAILKQINSVKTEIFTEVQPKISIAIETAIVEREFTMLHQVFGADFSKIKTQWHALRTQLPKILNDCEILLKKLEKDPGNDKLLRELQQKLLYVSELERLNTKIKNIYEPLDVELKGLFTTDSVKKKGQEMLDELESIKNDRDKLVDDIKDQVQRIKQGFASAANKQIGPSQREYRDEKGISLAELYVSSQVESSSPTLKSYTVNDDQLSVAAYQDVGKKYQYQEDRMRFDVCPELVSLTPEQRKSVLEKTFRELQESCGDAFQGSTLITSLLFNDEIYTASAGDSVGYVIVEHSDGSVTCEPLHARLHDIDEDSELKRLESEAEVNSRIRIERTSDEMKLRDIGGATSASRSLGDNNIVGVSHIPEIKVTKIPQDAKKVTVFQGSDSVYEALKIARNIESYSDDDLRNYATTPEEKTQFRQKMRELSQLSDAQFILRLYQEQKQGNKSLAELVTAMSKAGMNTYKSRDNFTLIAADATPARPDVNEGNAATKRKPRVLTVADGHGGATVSSRISEEFMPTLNRQIKLVQIASEIQSVANIFNAATKISPGMKSFINLYQHEILKVGPTRFLQDLSETQGVQFTKEFTAAFVNQSINQYITYLPRLVEEDNTKLTDMPKLLLEQRIYGILEQKDPAKIKKEIASMLKRQYQHAISGSVSDRQLLCENPHLLGVLIRNENPNLLSIIMDSEIFKSQHWGNNIAERERLQLAVQIKTGEIISTHHDQKTSKINQDEVFFNNLIKRWEAIASKVVSATMSMRVATEVRDLVFQVNALRAKLNDDDPQSLQLLKQIRELQSRVQQALDTHAQNVSKQTTKEKLKHAVTHLGEAVRQMTKSGQKDIQIKQASKEASKLTSQANTHKHKLK